MISTSTIKNKATAWSALLKPRILDTVIAGGETYVNISGINSVVSDTTNWYKITNNNYVPLIIDKVAGNVSGSDPNFYIDLTTSGLPAYPASIKVYISLTGLDADFTLSEPVNYNPVTKILYGMNDPIAYASQKVKIAVL